MIAIIDYGIGNLKSIYNMFKKVGTRNKEEVLKNYEKFLATPENERVGSLFK